MRVTWLLLVGASLMGCKGDEPDEVVAATCGVDNPPTWNSYADGFMRTWCTPCHHPDQVGEIRHGAPEGVDFHDLEIVRAYSASIALLALTDGGSMPPAGLAPEPQRSRMQTWIDCGMPGEQVAQPAPPCSLQTPFDGNLTLSSAPADFCDTYDSVSGDLLVDSDSDIAGCICAVDGDLDVVAEASLTELTEVGGDFVLGANALLPSLMNIGGDLVVVDGAGPNLTLPSLEMVAGPMLVQGVPSLAQFVTWRLSEAAGISVVDAPALQDMDFANSINELHGDLELVNTGLTEPRAFRRTLVHGDIRFAENAQLDAIDGFDALVAFEGSLTIEDNPVLRRLPGFPGMTDIAGDLTVTGNTTLNPLLAQGFADQFTVAGTVTVEQNGAP